MENKLSSIDWLKVTKKSEINDQSSIKSVNGENLFKINTYYSFSSDFTKIIVQSLVFLGKIDKPVPKVGKRPKEKFDIVFRNIYEYVSPSIEKPKKTPAEVAIQKEKIENWYQSKLASTEKGAAERKLKKEYRRKLYAISNEYTIEESNLKASEKWSQNNGQLAKKYLLESAYEISNMILSNISDTKTIAEYKKDKSQRLYKKGFQIVHEDENRVIVRDTHSFIKGRLCSLPKNATDTDC